MSSKEEFIARFKKWLKQPKKTRMITMDEYRRLEELTRFKCPVHINPADCIGHDCPTRPDNPWEDYYWECVEARKASNTLYSIMKGWITIHHDRTQGWEVPV